jgi:coenzyme F420-reducing hydrogenase alpha subunit
MPALTFPLSRIEGHAQVVIEVWGGQVHAAYFQATEIRGFELLVQGTPAEQMPVIAPRICGVCSTAHHVASVKALEDAYGVTPPPLARTLRELLLLGQLVQNQATSLFLFTMPDRLGATSLFDLVAPAAAAGDAVAQVARGALRVRKVGTDLISLAGGQFIHPIKAVVGGITSGIGTGEAAAMHAELAEMLPVARELVAYYVETSLALRERIGTWGDDEPTYYIAAGDRNGLNLDGDVVHVMGPDGAMRPSFAARDFRDHLVFQDTAYSYAGQTSYQGDVMRANSLARMNIIDHLGTPVADEYLIQFREAFGRPAHAILFFDLARCIELVYAMERAMEILAEPLDQEDADVPYSPRDGEGYGLVEAPRGPLIHHYRVENGLIAEAKFVIPTVHNSLAIERALRVAAQRYITAERVDMELERAVGRVVRAFDPCIACATH